MAISVSSMLRRGENFELQAYRRPVQQADLLKVTHVPFSGSALRHPSDPMKIILVTDPYSSNTLYYEFMAEDVEFVERLPSLTSAEGGVLNMVRIWIKKGRIGLRCTPFIVDETFGR